MHGSYILASMHGVYTIWIVYQYANGRISAIDPTSVMRVKYQDDLSTDLTYRLVYYIFFAFVVFFGLVYFTAQSFIRHPSSIIQVRREKIERQQRWETFCLFQYLCWLCLSTSFVFAVVVLFVSAQQNVKNCVSISTCALVGGTEEKTMGVHKKRLCTQWVAVQVHMMLWTVLSISSMIMLYQNRNGYGSV